MVILRIESEINSKLIKALSYLSSIQLNLHKLNEKYSLGSKDDGIIINVILYKTILKEIEEIDKLLETFHNKLLNKEELILNANPKIKVIIYDHLNRVRRKINDLYKLSNIKNIKDPDKVKEVDQIFKNMLLNLEEVISTLDSLFNEIFNFIKATQKRISFKIKFNKDNIYINTNVNINYGLNRKRILFFYNKNRDVIWKNVDKESVRVLMKGANYFNNSENFFNEIQYLFKYVLKKIFNEHNYLFRIVYGKFINLTINFDIVKIKNGIAAIFPFKLIQTRKKDLIRIENINDFDIKNLKISVDIDYLYDILVKKEPINNFVNVLLHEFVHLYDYNLFNILKYYKEKGISKGSNLLLVKIRSEGLALAGELFYGKSKYHFDLDFINRIHKKPIKSSLDIEYFERIRKQGLPIIDQIGEYIVFTIVMYLLTKNKDFNQRCKIKNLLLEEEINNALECIKDKEIDKRIKHYLMLLINLKIKNFYKYYIKACHYFSNCLLLIK